MPNIDKILGKLGQCRYFTTIDLAKGFHKIEMDPESIQKTAFSTRANTFGCLLVSETHPQHFKGA